MLVLLKALLLNVVEMTPQLFEKTFTEFIIFTFKVFLSKALLKYKVPKAIRFPFKRFASLNLLITF